MSLALIAAACSPAATFNPSGPCNADGKAPGAYPELEALLPTEFAGAPPTIVDSGRSCSSAALGSLAEHRVSELRFAGATWDHGSGRAATMAVLALPGAALPARWAEEFYELSARTAKRTGNIDVSRPEVEDVGLVFKLDTLNDLSFQTVVVWPDGERVRVVLVATPVNPSADRADHETFVDDALVAAAPGG